MFLFDYKKGVQIINFFAIKEGGYINELKCIKLIWLADRLNMVNYGCTITHDSYYAIKTGIIPSGIKELIDDVSFDETESNYRNEIIKKQEHNIYSLSEFDILYFSQSEIDIMNQIYESFKNYTDVELTEYSYNFPEWKKYNYFLYTTTRVNVDPIDFLIVIDKDFEYDLLFKKEQEWLDLLKELYQEKNKSPFNFI